MEVHVVFILAVALGIVQGKLINSCSKVKSFVNGHNERRLMLARGLVPGHPAASKMTYLIWDEELASKAAEWAEKNKYGHNPDKTIPSGRFHVGENIYWYGTTDKSFDFDPEMAMRKWWSEYRDFTYHELSMNDFTGSKKIGHYTQMAWAKTTRIGCGISQFHKNNWNNFYVVCNYGPAGNFLGRTPYESGDEASGHLVCGESDCSRKFGDAC